MTRTRDCITALAGIELAPRRAGRPDQVCLRTRIPDCDDGRSISGCQLNATNLYEWVIVEPLVNGALDAFNPFDRGADKYLDAIPGWFTGHFDDLAIGKSCCRAARMIRNDRLGHSTVCAGL